MFYIGEYVLRQGKEVQVVAHVPGKDTTVVRYMNDIQSGHTRCYEVKTEELKHQLEVRQLNDWTLTIEIAATGREVNIDYECMPTDEELQSKAQEYGECLMTIARRYLVR